MAPAAIASNSTYPSNDQSLHSAALELKHERSARLVDMISKDEDVRKLRFEIHVLEDDNDELRDLLAQEEDRSDSLAKLVSENLARAEEAERALQDADSELQAKEQEVSKLRAEAQALENITNDSSKTLIEKLELTRELSTLKPELEHLRALASTNEKLIAEKLTLQRDLSEVQVQLEHSKREAKRLLAKRRNTQHDLAQEDQLEELRKALKREQRLKEKAQEAAETAQAELEAERKAAQNKSIKDAKELEDDAQVESQAEELRQQLASSRKEQDRAEKALQKAQNDWEAQKSILDDKLNQFRTKLKSTKEKLKETEAELEKAQQAADTAVAKPDKATAAKKPAKKRSAAQMDPDATNLGTPGDGGKQAKRCRKAAAAVGDKSTFSITPFLNRTVSVAPDSPEADGKAINEEDENVESEAEKSPTQPQVTSAGPTAKTKKPLAPVPASKGNIKKASVQQRKKPTITALEKVTEEEEISQGQENVVAVTAKVPLEKPLRTKDSASNDTQKKKPRMRKSLATFATFNLEPEPEKKKKRQLGGLGKTLFDEEEETAPGKALTGRGGLFGNARAFGPLGGLKSGGLLGGKKGGLLTAGDGSGFQFSPLKKEKKMMSFLK